MAEAPENFDFILYIAPNKRFAKSFLSDEHLNKYMNELIQQGFDIEGSIICSYGGDLNESKKVMKGGPDGYQTVPDSELTNELYGDHNDE